MNDIIIKVINSRELSDIPLIYICRIAVTILKLWEEQKDDKSLNT